MARFTAFVNDASVNDMPKNDMLLKKFESLFRAMFAPEENRCTSNNLRTRLGDIASILSN